MNNTRSVTVHSSTLVKRTLEAAAHKYQTSAPLEANNFSTDLHSLNSDIGFPLGISHHDLNAQQVSNMSHILSSFKGTLGGTAGGSGDGGKKKKEGKIKKIKPPKDRQVVQCCICRVASTYSRKAVCPSPSCNEHRFKDCIKEHKGRQCKIETGYDTSTYCYPPGSRRRQPMNSSH